MASNGKVEKLEIGGEEGEGEGEGEGVGVVDGKGEAEGEYKEEKEEGRKFNWWAQWYPITIAAELDKKVPTPAMIMGMNLVLWWDRKGASWQVFSDYCPHRLAPLSEGRIDKESGDLQCCYHGWTFAPCTGACTRIPQAPPNGNPVWKSTRASATVYPSVEQQGIIWFWPDPRAEYKDIAERKLPPSIPVFDDPNFSGILAMRDFPFGYEQLIENLMDPAHVHFAHHGLQGNRNMGMPLNLKVEKIDKNGFIGSGGGRLGIFTAPCTWAVHLSFLFPKQMNQAKDESASKKMVMVTICIPVSSGRSRLIWSFPRNFSLWADRIIPKWYNHIHQMLVLDSDLYMLHRAERKLMEMGNQAWDKSCYVPTGSDSYVIGFRKWLRVYAGGGPDWRSKNSEQLPPQESKEKLMDRYHSHVVSCRYCRSALHFFEGAELFLQTLSIGSAAALGAAALKPHPSLKKWTIPLICTSIASSAASRWLSHFIQKTYYFHGYNHATVE